MDDRRLSFKNFQRKVKNTFKKVVKRPPVPLLIVGGALLSLILLVFTRPGTQSAPTQEVFWPVSAMTVVFGTHQPMIRLYGVVESPRHSELRAAVQANVKNVPIRKGESVQAGQLLIELDNQEALLVRDQRAAELKDLLAQLATEKKRYETDKKLLADEKIIHKLEKKTHKRQLVLLKSRVSSPSEMEQALISEKSRAITLGERQHTVGTHQERIATLQAQIQKSQAQLALAELDVTRTRITAPFSGRITDLTTAKGSRVHVGDKLVNLVDPAAFEVRALLPTRYLPEIKRGLKTGGLKGTAQMAGFPVDMILTRLSSKIEKSRGGMDGFLEVTRGGDHLALEQTLVISLALPPEHSVLAVPSTAFYNNTVYKVVGDRLEAVPVTLVGSLAADPKHLLLLRTNQLKAGDVLLTTHLPNAMTGLGVKILKANG